MALARGTGRRCKKPGRTVRSRPDQKQQGLRHSLLTMLQRLI